MAAESLCFHSFNRFLTKTGLDCYEISESFQFKSADVTFSYRRFTFDFLHKVKSDHNEEILLEDLVNKWKLEPSKLNG